MNRYPAKVAATLQQRLVDKAHPLVISIDRERRVREIQGDAARYGYPDNQVEPLLQLCADMLVGADAAQPGFWPLVHLAQGHHVALHWIPDEPFDHVIITDSDLCNAELAERQQAANELALAGIEKSRTIRELKRVRLELEAREQALKDTQAFQRRLIDTLAHDLRTPLTSISGYAALMQPYVDDITPLKRALGAIQRNAMYLKALAENLLELARQGHPEASALQRQPVSLGELASDVETIVRPMADGKGLGFEVRTQSGDVRMPSFDPLKLEQILLNLLSNAVRYTPAGGRVDAQIGWDGQTLVLTVTDNGIGIAPEYQQRVFEPLNRGAQQGREGAGLGLSIVRQLVDAMGGKLELQSAVGVGTRIEIRLPEEPPTPGAEGVPASAPGEPPLALRNRRVLVVDDDPDICELLLWSLREIGYQPEILHDAGKVQTRVDTFDPGLVVIDVDLGLRSGLVVTQELRLHGYRGAIVVFSGAADQRTRRAAERAGADAFLPKPLDPTRFHDWMKRVLPAV